MEAIPDVASVAERVMVEEGEIYTPDMGEAEMDVDGADVSTPMFSSGIRGAVSVFPALSSAMV